MRNTIKTLLASLLMLCFAGIACDSGPGANTPSGVMKQYIAIASKDEPDLEAYLAIVNPNQREMFRKGMGGNNQILKIQGERFRKAGGVKSMEEKIDGDKARVEATLNDGTTFGESFVRVDGKWYSGT